MKKILFALFALAFLTVGYSLPPEEDIGKQEIQKVDIEKNIFVESNYDLRNIELPGDILVYEYNEDLNLVFEMSIDPGSVKGLDLVKAINSYRKLDTSFKAKYKPRAMLSPGVLCSNFVQSIYEFPDGSYSLLQFVDGELTAQTLTKGAALIWCEKNGKHFPDNEITDEDIPPPPPPGN